MIDRAFPAEFPRFTDLYPIAQKMKPYIERKYVPIITLLYVLKELELSKVILEGYVITSDSNLAAIKRELANHIELTRQEEGCLIFEVTQDNENINRFNVYEEFTSQEAFNAHQQRLSSTEWGKVSSQLEKHYKTSDIN